MMNKRYTVGWDVSHMEFTIEDHYYFSRLKSILNESGVLVSEVSDFRDLADFDTLVFNYPERPFSLQEVRFVRDRVEEGKRVIVTGYYNNEDRISDTVNTLSSFFGVELNRDEVRDERYNDDGDELLPVTGRLMCFNESVSSVLLPCCASVTLLKEDVKPFILKNTEDDNTVMGTVTRLGSGEFVLLGTCVFWDNFSISKYNNKEFSINLLINGRG